MLKGGNPLTVGVGIIIEVIRKNNSDYDPEIGTGVDSIPSSRDPIYLGNLLRLFATHVPDFMKLILSHGITVTDVGGVRTEVRRELKVAFGGAIEPLGFDRFKTCELMAELLHCSNMGLLNEKGGEKYVTDRDRERERLKAQRNHNLLVEGLADSTRGIEGVVVEKAPLQVQNGGVEMSDDGIIEEDFEDVLDSGMLDDARADENTGGQSEAKKDDDDDIFVDEPLSPQTAPKDAPISKEVAELPALATKLPKGGVADKKPVSEENDVKTDEIDIKMGDAPDQGEEVQKADSEKEVGHTSSSKAEGNVPRAPSPPHMDGEDGSVRKDGRSLVEGLKASADNVKLSEISSERLDAELPPLPIELQNAAGETSAGEEEENLMDLNSTPDTAASRGHVSIRSLGSFESNYTEYQAMVEPDLDGNPVVGDFLKMMFVEHHVVPTILVRS